MLMLTVGTGIGGAFLERGKLLKGHTYSACEVGYMHMDGSSFEELAATSVLVKRTAKRLSKSCLEISGKWIFEQAQSGNKVCIEEIDRMCDILAKGIAIVLCAQSGNRSDRRGNFCTGELFAAKD